MEGSLNAALSRLDGPDRASWTFSNPKSGPLLQHAPLGWHTWASGSVAANVRFTSCESEGKAGEPLTPSQVDNLVLLIRAVGEHEGWTLRRPVDDADLSATGYEHRECVRFGSAPTACPSGRINWDVILSKLQEEDEMPKIIGTSYKNNYWGFACDGMSRTWLANPAVVAALQAAGALSAAPAGFMARDLLVTVPCIGVDPIA
jgi:hypothetical protein